MKSLQFVAGACAVLLASTSVFAAPQLFPSTPPPAPATPSPEVQALLTEGLAAYQKGDMVKAKEAFEMVYSMDPRNTVAIGYLRRIKAGEGTAPKSVDKEKQLAAIILPQVQFREATLGSALDYFKRTVEKQTGGRLAISFVVQLPVEVVNAPNVTLSLSNIPVTEALRYLGDQVNANVVYEKYAIVVKPKNGAAAPTAQTVPVTPAQ